MEDRLIFDRHPDFSTEDIIAGLRLRDPAAVAYLYDMLGKKLYSVILTIVRDKQTAEDLVQDTFVKVCNSSQQFHGDNTALAAWLLAIGRHRAIDYIRAKRRNGAEGSVSLDVDYHSDLLTAGINFSAGDVESVREVIRRLPCDQRRVIDLAYYEGLSHNEMAVRLGVPLGTVKSWTRLALKRLRESISSQARYAGASEPHAGRERRAM
jgi:RNA polymerase sigma-70 factor (ECF subfamily)